MKLVLPKWFIKRWVAEYGREPTPADVPGGVCTSIEVADLPEMDLPGAWSRTDFLGGPLDEVRGPDWTPP